MQIDQVSGWKARIKAKVSDTLTLLYYYFREAKYWGVDFLRSLPVPTPLLFSLEFDPLLLCIFDSL